ncbi:DNA polymerase [uncultured archaeon]|nr:DNA polymerase [uncultured archaeon]
MEQVELEGIILDVDYLNLSGKSAIRVTLKSQEGKVFPILDTGFHPHFYLVPSNKSLEEGTILSLSIFSDFNQKIEITKVERKDLTLRGKAVTAFAIYTNDSKDVPRLKDYIKEFGECYEYDIPFWKRYLIDKGISPLSGVSIKAHRSEQGLIVDFIGPSSKTPEVKLKQVCFDIETYNAATASDPRRDPVLMISYTDGNESGVLTTKKIDRDFVTVFDTEKKMIEGFVEVVKRLDPDIIAGYNSSNFDMPYLMTRSKALRADFDISRYGEEPKSMHHGLTESVKIPGRINLDIYNVARFVSVVGAAEQLLRTYNLKLDEVHTAVTGKKKKMVNKKYIWRMWDNGGEELEELSEYSLGDSISLNELYEFFIPLEVETAKVSGTTLNEASVSTVGQLAEFLLMRYAHENGEIVPNRPDDREIRNRMAHTFEGAYVKTPDAGIYDNIVVFDFRGLYPSMIIAHNIDPATICTDCKDYFEAPTGVRFATKPQGILPKVLELLINERMSVKKAYKKDLDNKSLGARSNALKILANSFYGYLGYARSRWYSRDCASSVTALGRAYIINTMEEAERFGFKSLYSDTDSTFLLAGDKNDEEVLAFLKHVNGTLPKAMELELEDFYTRGVFVGKRTESAAGAKKKYALLSRSGRVKIKGFELVRRDWSGVARSTQRAVLDAILHKGSKEEAIEIVKNVIKELRSGRTPLKELVIHTQLRKSIGSYDSKSPELAAVQKAIKQGVHTKEELEGATIGYVITTHGGTISEKAQLEDIAKDYDADYYIGHQVVPATLRILKELGIDEEELKGGGEQRRLL